MTKRLNFWTGILLMVVLAFAMTQAESTVVVIALALGIFAVSLLPRHWV